MAYPTNFEDVAADAMARVHQELVDEESALALHESEGAAAAAPAGLVQEMSFAKATGESVATDGVIVMHRNLRIEEVDFCIEQLHALKNALATLPIETSGKERYLFCLNLSEMEHDLRRMKASCDTETRAEVECSDALLQGDRMNHRRRSSGESVAPADASNTGTPRWLQACLILRSVTATTTLFIEAIATNKYEEAKACADPAKIPASPHHVLFPHLEDSRLHGVHNDKRFSNFKMLPLYARLPFNEWDATAAFGTLRKLSRREAGGTSALFEEKYESLATRANAARNALFHGGAARFSLTQGEFVDTWKAFEALAFEIYQDCKGTNLESTLSGELLHIADYKMSTYIVKKQRARLLGRFEVDAMPKHVSDTSVVIFAMDMTRDGVPVALKFFRNKEAWSREIECRDRFHLCSQFVTEIVYSQEVNAADLLEFPQIRLSSRHEPLSHLIVMPRSIDGDLFDIIQHANIAGKERAQAIDIIAVGIAKALQYINESGIMHGDVKSRNFIPRKGNWRGFSCIDLDAATCIDGHQNAGQKRTSTGYLPPEQAEYLLFELDQPDNSMSRASMQTRIHALEQQVQAALKDRHYDEVGQLAARLEDLKSSKFPATPPQPVKASMKYDMWCFGVLLYELCTNRRLFEWDNDENVDVTELQHIAEWSKKRKMDALSRVQPRWPRYLLDALLQKDPEERPPNWTVVINCLECQDIDSASNRYSRAARLEKDILAIGMRKLFRLMFSDAHGHQWINGPLYGKFLVDGGAPPWDPSGAAVSKHKALKGTKPLLFEGQCDDIDKLDVTALRALLVGTVHTGLDGPLLTVTKVPQLSPHQKQQQAYHDFLRRYNITSVSSHHANLTRGDVVCLCAQRVRNVLSHAHSYKLTHAEFAEVTSFLQLFAEKCLPNDDEYSQLLAQARKTGVFALDHSL